MPKKWNIKFKQIQPATNVSDRVEVAILRLEIWNHFEGNLESLWRKLLLSLQKLFQVFDNHFHRTLILFQNEMVTIFIHPSYFCSHKCCSEIQNFRLAAKFTFSANIICYNDPNFLCWRNLLTEILHFELAQNSPHASRLWSPMAENWPLFSLLWHLWIVILKSRLWWIIISTQSFDFTHSFPDFSHELCTLCPIFVHEWAWTVLCSENLIFHRHPPPPSSDKLGAWLKTEWQVLTSSWQSITCSPVGNGKVAFFPAKANNPFALHC